ncbi:glycosyltransferase [Frigoribacterium sp. ACAM 257]|uniref:rhamnosyltransferase WsaF family glycosyltransferase n=1 Tax=Frigoribacterium sp. ACAM 257 TaxID=2508998 RepID=UPI0011B9B6D8|nr:glycosyltransferase [Frigoribacterium sp. ACAM 257]TWX40263.1 glycosyltransferase [Frigoribacterium sp. ACAM 257]
MNAAKIGHLLKDLARVNRAYVANGSYRNDVRERLAPPSARRRTTRPGDSRNTSIAQAESDNAPLETQAFAGLVETSLSLAGITVQDGAEPRLNLVVGEIREGAAFAGIQTAVTVGLAMSRALHVPLRVVMVSYTTTGNSSSAALEFLRSRFQDAAEVELFAREDIPTVAFSSQDFWLVTHWKTAHAVDVAVQGGRIAPDRVAYLMQDYEPGFSPWSTEYAVAASTYQHGFEPIVNSEPLRAYLEQHQGLAIPRSRTFAPDLDLDLLRRVSLDRRKEQVTRVLFYGRPSKHRNLYRLGLTALRMAARELHEEDLPVEFVSAGEKHRAVDLGSGHKLTSVGTLPWDEYFDLLASTNVVLSLQYSPHPSHPPFDAAISGAYAVTNDFGGTRRDLHERLDAVATEPRALADAIVAAVRRERAEGPGSFLPVRPGALGGSLADAVATTASTLLTRP